MRNWMFISQYSAIREFLIENYDLRLLGDLETGAFEEVSAAQVILSVVMSIFRKMKPSDEKSIAFRPTPNDLKSEGNIARKLAALLSQVNGYEFKTQNFNVIKEKPLIYWWDDAFLKRYAETPKLGEVYPAWQGMATTNDPRFLRKPWEVLLDKILISRSNELSKLQTNENWASFIKGASGRVWLELWYILFGGSKKAGK